MMKTFATAAALACIAVGAPAMAQQAPAVAQDTGVTVGATVYGPQGGVVGTIDRIVGSNVVINTGTMEATVPADVIAVGENGPVIAVNKTDLEAAIMAAEQQATAALDAALVPATQLYSSDGVVVGTITEVEPAGLVVVEHTSAGPIKLRKDEMAVQGGNVTLLTTAAALEAAVSAQAPAAAAATAATDATAGATATDGAADASTQADTTATAEPAPGM